MVKPALPVFARVTLCVALVPVLRLPKLSEVGVIVSWGAVATPVPARPTTSGELGVLFISVRLPVTLPAEAGVNPTLKVEEPPAGIASGSVKPE